MKCLVSLLLVVFVVAGKWMLFEKMGEKAWKSLIPVYSTYVIFKDVWNTEMFVFDALLKLSCMSFAVLAFVMAGMNGMDMVVGTLAMTTLGLMVAELFVTMQVMYYLSKSFGHGVGYTAGLMFLEPVFYFLLGMSKNKYMSANA